MLKNVYVLAKIGADTAENEQHFAENLPTGRRVTGAEADVGTRRVVANCWQISAKFRSFSAVSTPIFASKYAFCSIFQNLPDYRAGNFANFADPNPLTLTLKPQGGPAAPRRCRSSPRRPRRS